VSAIVMVFLTGMWAGAAQAAALAINDLGNLTILEDAGPQTVPLAGIAGTNTIKVTAASDLPDIMPNPTVTYRPGSTGS
jgi:hypothetical protein